MIQKNIPIEASKQKEQKKEQDFTPTSLPRHSFSPADFFEKYTPSKHSKIIPETKEEPTPSVSMQLDDDLIFPIEGIFKPLKNKTQKGNVKSPTDEDDMPFANEFSVF